MDANEDLSPRVGMEFNTLEDAWEFWLKYGRQMGFDVRKHYINKSKKDGKITSRGFVCAKQGIRGSEKEDLSYLLWCLFSIFASPLMQNAFVIFWLPH